MSEHETEVEPYYVSAAVERALTEAARTGRDVNIGGALYRKANHGEQAHPAPTHHRPPGETLAEETKA